MSQVSTTNDGEEENHHTHTHNQANLPPPATSHPIYPFTPVTTTQDNLHYLHGFHNHYESEALPNMLPRHRNNPKICPGGLYAEQISGTAFTAPNSQNYRTWLYRSQPSVRGTSSMFTPVGGKKGGDGSMSTNAYFGHVDWSKDFRLDPNPLRWLPKPIPIRPVSTDEEETSSNQHLDEQRPTTFIEGTYTMAGSGDPSSKDGIAIHIYTFNANMRKNRQNHGGQENDQDVHMYNSDGDFLIVPQHGSLDIVTELGRMIVHPSEFCVIPRGFVFSVNLHDGDEGTSGARGYILEIFRGHFDLPELGPIGSNGLANARDFLIPTASFDAEGKNTSCKVCVKFGNQIFERSSPHSPYNVVAWHGNYVPYKYNLEHFCCMNSVTYDHPDPSIYTVLTVPSHLEPGVALADFVVFPRRWVAMDQDTFRPPWYHRNCMSEYMGLIEGEYDAKSKEGFIPGGSSLHNTMVPHGPDDETFRKATSKDAGKEPTYLGGGLAFMFETCCTLKVSTYALFAKERDWDYPKCWDG